MPRTFGLIDGNAFYCSCERAFSPRLRGRAVVVLNTPVPMMENPA